MKRADVRLLTENRVRFLLYNTCCEVILTDTDRDCRPLLQGAVAIAQQVQMLLDSYDPCSELSALNREGAPGRAVPLSPELFALLDRLLAAAAASDGRFDPTIGPVLDLWDFPRRRPHVPSRADVQAALHRCGHNKVELDPGAGTVRFLEKGMRLDCGAAGKGYAAERMAAYLKAGGTRQGVINLGGSLCLMGPENRWRVGIQQPWMSRGEAAGILRAGGEAMASSGGYDRYFCRGGKVYHHLIDPQSGFPADSGIVGCTALCRSPLDADLFSTIFFVGGRQTGCRAAKALHKTVDYVLLHSGGEITLSPALSCRFTPSNDWGPVRFVALGPAREENEI